MNDSISILLATTILALGGLGLYMYKSTDDIQKEGEDEYIEDSIFGEKFWDSTDDENYVKENINESFEDDYKPRRKTTKTQRNRKSSGISKRRY